jgi:hypothetical protein
MEAIIACLIILGFVGFLFYTDNKTRKQMKQGSK